MTEEKMKWMAAIAAGGAAVALGVTSVGIVMGQELSKRDIDIAATSLIGAAIGAAVVAAGATTYWGQKLPPEQLALGTFHNPVFP